MYNTALGVLFGVKKYAAVLEEICKKRNIKVNLRHTLVEVKPSSNEAVFNVTDSDNKVIKQETFPVRLLICLMKFTHTHPCRDTIFVSV